MEKLSINQINKLPCPCLANTSFTSPSYELSVEL